MMNNNKPKLMLVANGSKALVYRCKENIQDIEMLDKFTSEASRLKSHDLSRDKAGQGKEGADESIKNNLGSTGDLHKKEKHNFLQYVSDHVNNEVNKGIFVSLIIAASPEALGEIRKFLNKKARELITHEIDRDLTHVLMQDIPDFIEKYIEE